MVVKPFRAVAAGAENGSERGREVGRTIEVQADDPSLKSRKREIFNRVAGKGMFGDLVYLQGTPPVGHGGNEGVLNEFFPLALDRLPFGRRQVMNPVLKPGKSID